MESSDKYYPRIKNRHPLSFWMKLPDTPNIACWFLPMTINVEKSSEPSCLQNEKPNCQVIDTHQHIFFLTNSGEFLERTPKLICRGDKLHMF